MTSTDYRDWRGGTFFETVTAAVADIAEHGFDSIERVEFWAARIREAAQSGLGSIAQLTKELQDSLTAIYNRAEKNMETGKRGPEVPRFTAEKLKPAMRQELNRKLFASRSLIRLNREDAMRATEQRFLGWATSVPEGGLDDVDKRKVKAHMGKALRSLPYEERRVIIDQTHKLASALDETIALGNGAIAGIWHSKVGEAGYDFRPSHALRNRKIYLIRDSWADKAALVKPANGYTDDITAPGEEIFCRCSYQYIYSPRALPADMLTEKGKAWVSAPKR